MRIEFPHAAQSAFPWSGNLLRVGSAADNDMRIEGQGVADHHAVLAKDARGLVLEVCRGAGRVYVNARPVREKALLRCGDSLGIGACRLRIVADAVAGPEDDADVPAQTLAVVALRAVAGPLSGRVYALDEKLLLDAHGPVAADRSGNALSLEPCGRHVRLDAAKVSTPLVVSVNGLQVRQALLGDGDQIVIGTHRFVLDVSADAAVPPTPVDKPSLREADIDRRHGAHPEMWWLIATAAVLALIVAGILLVHY